MRYLLLASFILLAQAGLSQVQSVDSLDQEYLNWQNKDLDQTGFMGTSVDKAYKELLQDKSDSGETIIVAVIDNGVDIDHEDLKGRIWTNKGEIPNNQIDDDHNGYVDDIHGWNFLGNSKGENINYENLDYVRIIRNEDPKDSLYPAAQKLYNEELQKRKEEKNNIKKFESIYHAAITVIKNATDVEVKGPEDLAKVHSSDKRVNSAKNFLKERYDMGFTEEGLQELVEQNHEFLDYHLNTSFAPRKIIGDNLSDINDSHYGNPDVKGPTPRHGTSVAAVIAAIRDNGLGINGIATNVKIMPVRAVPNGDERDKDVALAIRYAVDNGAQIINMSFGKALSPHKRWVDDAIRYAASKGVLLVHAAGNEGNHIDDVPSYPSDVYNDGMSAQNMINIGASSPKLDQDIAAIFSNYSKSHVDIFAPGVNIISADSSSTYSMNSGTSLSSPVVTGIAALVLSHYPNLSPAELIDILESSAYHFKKPRKVLTPSPSFDEKSRKKAKFSELSKSGGIVNAYNALQEAAKREQSSATALK